MKGKLFVAFLRKGNSSTEEKVLNGRGEKKRFLSSLKKGVTVLAITRVRDPVRLNALRMRM